MLSGDGFDYHCHSNLTRAILPYGLNEFDVHDVLNVFQVTGLNQNGQYFMYVRLRVKRHKVLHINIWYQGKQVQPNRATSSNFLPKSTSFVPCPHALGETYLLGDGEPVMIC